jgi:hypothetical protein
MWGEGEGVRGVLRVRASSTGCFAATSYTSNVLLLPLKPLLLRYYCYCLSAITDLMVLCVSALEIVNHRTGKEIQTDRLIY